MKIPRLFGMMKYALLICSAVIITGCSQSTSEKSKIPHIDSTNCLKGKAVVSYYLEEGRTYLTAQEHIYCPGSNRLSIIAEEPQGNFIYQYSPNGYSESASSSDDIKDAFWNKALVKTIHHCISYGGEFNSIKNSQVEEPEKILGQWYIPAKIDSKLTLYRNKDTDKLELVKIVDADGKIWMAKGYNWAYYGPTGNLIPRTIDFFDISNGLSSKKLKIRLDYKQVD